MAKLLLVALFVSLAAAFNVGAPRPALTRPAVSRAALPVMEEAIEEEIEEEEAMTEEEYEAELAREAERRQANLAQGEKEEEEQLLAPGEAERIKAEIKKRAPWMDIDPEAIARAKKQREERKKSATAIDSMRIDPQAAELGAASGLNSKVLGEDEVELRWETQDEVGNLGFMVQRRPGGQPDFQTIATFENFAPLKTKGEAGGTYVYLDSESGLQPGTWVYRILDCDTSGAKTAMCQKLVEIESKDEQTQTLIVGGFIATLALVLVGAGIFIDPIQTTSAGRGGFF